MVQNLLGPCQASVFVGKAKWSPTLTRNKLELTEDDELSDPEKMKKCNDKSMNR